MAHQLTIGANGLAEMAYAGEKPWHGLGQELQRGAPIETWQTAAGLDWEILRSGVHYHNDGLQELKSHDVLYRSDNNRPLAVVTNRYKEVQPKEIMEFFRDLIDENGFEMETAGTLMGGKRIWALAKTGLGGEVVAGDHVNAYLLLVTSYDNALATTAQFTSVRVVCNNTLHMSLNREVETRVRVRHNTTFDAAMVKDELELGLGAKQHYDQFMNKMRRFSEQSLSNYEAEDIIARLMTQKGTTGNARTSRGFKTIMQLFGGVGKGSSLDGVAGTKWGLINAVTQYADFHIRAKSQDNRLNSSWFGAGAKMKNSIVQFVEQV